MASSGDKDFKLGFLAAIELPGGGYVGGLLVTNRMGRPLEFQCTTPVKPNRTQEILYGPTLKPYVLGELIGKTLVDKATVKPDLILTEDEALLEVRLHIPQPAATVHEANGTELPASLRFGRQRLRFHPSHIEDEHSWSKPAATVPEQADFVEPFERIREALQETIRVGSGR